MYNVPVMQKGVVWFFRLANISCISLHTQNLAAHNILVGDDETCKVADSGLLLEVPRGDSIKKCADISYHVRWMPPESISQHKFSSASDVWSFGILLWEMFNPGKIPYEKFDDMQVATNVRIC